MKELQEQLDQLPLGEKIDVARHAAEALDGTTAEPGTPAFDRFLEEHRLRIAKPEIEAHRLHLIAMVVGMVFDHLRKHGITEPKRLTEELRHWAKFLRDYLDRFLRDLDPNQYRPAS